MPIVFCRLSTEDKQALRQFRSLLPAGLSYRGAIPSQLQPSTIPVYGMNFEFMPEREWPFGYRLAIGLMVVSAIVPFWISGTAAGYKIGVWGIVITAHVIAPCAFAASLVRSAVCSGVFPSGAPEESQNVSRCDDATRSPL